MNTALALDTSGMFRSAGPLVIGDPCYSDATGDTNSLMLHLDAFPDGTYPVHSAGAGIVLLGSRGASRQYAGSFPVDSGQFIISSLAFYDAYQASGGADVDFIITDESAAVETDAADYSFFCHASLYNDNGSGLYAGDSGSVYVSSTAWGDGSYAVVLHMDVTGLIVGIEIDTENDFDGDPVVEKALEG